MRKIDTLIWHCSATPEGREISVKEIDRWHKKRGWSGIGYHKVVQLDGAVNEGRPMNKVGAHVKGHNTGSLGYVYIGGVTAAGKPKDTRTPAQKATMERLTREAIEDFGVTKVYGHNEFANKACPSFDVQTDSTIQNAIRGRRPPVATLDSKVLPAAIPMGRGGIVAIIAVVLAAIAAFLKAQGVW